MSIERSTDSPPQTPQHGSVRMSRPRSRRTRTQWRTIFWSLPRQRLLDSVEEYRAELEARAGLGCSPPGEVQHLLDLLDKAAAAARAGETELGWRYWFTAHRLELLELDERGREAYGWILLAEAREKLGGWRLDAIQHLVASSLVASPPTDLDCIQLYVGTVLLHEHHGNIYTRVRILRRQLGWMIFMTIATLVAWGIILWRWRAARMVLTAAATVLDRDLALVPSVIACGILGAAFSAFLSLARPGSRRTIPQHMQGNTVTISRLAAGVLAAIAVYLLLASGVLNLVSPLKPSVVLVFAFAVGFSERIVVKSLESLGGTEQR